MDKISELFTANDLVVEKPKVSHNQEFKKRNGTSKRMLINMRKAGCKSIQEYKDKVKRRKRSERLHRRIKHKEARSHRNN